MSAMKKIFFSRSCQPELLIHRWGLTLYARDTGPVTWLPTNRTPPSLIEYINCRFLPQYSSDFSSFDWHLSSLKDILNLKHPSTKNHNVRSWCQRPWRKAGSRWYDSSICSTSPLLFRRGARALVSQSVSLVCQLPQIIRSRKLR